MAGPLPVGTQLGACAAPVLRFPSVSFPGVDTPVPGWGGGLIVHPQWSPASSCISPLPSAVSCASPGAAFSVSGVPRGEPHGRTTHPRRSRENAVSSCRWIKKLHRGIGCIRMKQTSAL